jgi:lysophospholipase L1-like esterase
MNQLPFPLDYLHKFNIHKWLGLLVADDDLRSIARIYGASHGELRKIERRYQENVVRLAAGLKQTVKGPEASSPLTVLALGDSISSDREGYVRILNSYWKGTSRAVLDCAISGNTTSSLLDRLYDSAMTRQFDWIVIFIGTNDNRQLDDRWHIPVTGLDEYRRNMDYFTDLFPSLGKKVILVTVPPVDNKRFGAFLPKTRRNYDPARIAAANQVLRDIGKRKNIAVADLAAAIDAQTEDVLTPDGLHLNDTGHLILCRLLLGILP